MNRILVPVDFSDTSVNALRYALELFKDSDPEVSLVHFYGTPHGGAFLMKNIDRIMEREDQAELDKLVERIIKEYPDVRLNPQLIKNDAASTIASMGNSGKYDWIVMGTKGASGLKEVFLGSVAGSVVKNTAAPVIVVPDEYQYRRLDEILLAMGNEPYEASVLKPLANLANQQQSKLKVLNIVEKSAEKIDVPLGELASLQPDKDYVFGTGDVNKDLNDYLLKDSASMLCMVRANKGFFQRLFGESFTLKQTFNSPLPLLILHE